MDNGKSRIIEILTTFTGRDGEPANNSELYILKAMWLMMLSEFEGSIKYLVESYIDQVKNTNIEKIHICLLLQNFFPNSENSLSINKIINVHKKDPKNISYANFTRDFKPKYKADAVEKLFNTLGIFFSTEEIISLKILDGIASTRDSIAHGDTNIQITKRELNGRLSDLHDIFILLKRKLSL